MNETNSALMKPELMLSDTKHRTEKCKQASVQTMQKSLETN